VADKQLVLAIFADEAAADRAVELLKDRAKGSQLARRPVGVLVLDEQGRIKEHKLGQTSGGKGAGIGLVLAALTPPTLLAGIVGGAVIGHFHHKGLGLTDEDRERIAAELAGGKAAVGVLVEGGDEPWMASSMLKLFGGEVEAHDVSDEALEAVAAAAPAAPAAPAATETPAAES
jgi:uncharacterized membrane protein